jgi:hypothetical protein
MEAAGFLSMDALAASFSPDFRNPFNWLDAAMNQAKV